MVETKKKSCTKKISSRNSKNNAGLIRGKKKSPSSWIYWNVRFLDKTRSVAWHRNNLFDKKIDIGKNVSHFLLSKDNIRINSNFIRMINETFHSFFIDELTPPKADRVPRNDLSINSIYRFLSHSINYLSTNW